MAYLKGKFTKTLFQSEDGYHVCLFKIKETDEEISSSVIVVTGYFYEINYQTDFLLKGNLVNHHKYGKQYLVSSLETMLAEDKDSIVEFLASDLFPGIGEKTAKAITDKFGEDSLNIILEHPEDLYLLPKISKKQIDLIHQTLKEHYFSYKIVLRMIELGFTSKEASRILSYFKETTEDIINQDLYQFLKINNLSFKRIDEIALNNNYSFDDLRRVKAGILETLKDATTYGHVYLEETLLYKTTLKTLKAEILWDLFIEAKDSLLTSEIYQKDKKYYLLKNYLDEEYLASKIKRTLSKKDSPREDKLLAKSSSLKYNELQKEAILLSLAKHFLVISGGPGTGKTTIIRAIVDLYKEKHQLTKKQLEEEVVLVSPTGRASKRLADLSGMPTSTIHRFLKWRKVDDSFYLNEFNKSNLKLLIVDEASMIDLNLMAALFKATLESAKIILVGDYNQLASIGPGQVLKDIIESNLASVISLKEIYRQAENSNIITLAHNLNSDRSLSLESFDDLKFIETKDILEEILNIAKSYLNYDYRQFQILAPMYKGINGIDNLNLKLQELFNPKSPKKNEKKVFEVIYREGDKVIQLINMPEYNIFNGDIGIITSISKEITIQFDEEEVIYGANEFQNFSLAYAISIHKAQGSEFDIVILPLSSSYRVMLYKKLYYTAISRAKKKLYLIGEINLLSSLAENKLGESRKTTLKDKLNS